MDNTKASFSSTDYNSMANGPQGERLPEFVLQFSKVEAPPKQ